MTIKELISDERNAENRSRTMAARIKTKRWHELRLGAWEKYQASNMGVSHSRAHSDPSEPSA
jgi:hypothetical protein